MLIGSENTCLNILFVFATCFDQDSHFSFIRFQLPNVKIKNMGTMLEINPVTIESAGEYRCQGINEVTKNTVNSQFTVFVRGNYFVKSHRLLTSSHNYSV